MTFQELRDKNLIFKYENYCVEEKDEHIEVRFKFNIEGIESFEPSWRFPKKEGYDLQLVKTMAFQLGMAESISYWKLCCPKKFIVECGQLTSWQKQWWKKLFYNGLGEFMYLNNIVISEEEFIDIIADEAECIYDDAKTYEKVLVPVGGGKDSIVSMDVLENEKFVTYHINESHSIMDIVDACTDKSEDYFARRFLDRKMIELNSQGYLNGHTPFSAIVAFSSVISAHISGCKYIALSNENSANESTVRDSFVNHQYSKSYEFENDFQTYFKSFTNSDIHYFSLLRPLNEMQIAKIFSHIKKYHPIFRSCNVGSKKGAWCCNCAKCLFVYIILSPFLSDDELNDIFGENLLVKESLKETLLELMGISENKPFECVGTRREVVASLKKYILDSREIMLNSEETKFVLSSTDDVDAILAEWNDENAVPEEYQQILKGKLDA